MGYKLSIRYAFLLFIVVFIVCIRHSFKSINMLEERLIKKSEKEILRNKVETTKTRKIRQYKAIDAYEVRYTTDEKAPGEMGRGVIVDDKKLIPEEQKVYKKGWSRNAFNQYVSDMISVKRNLPDYRWEECKNLTYRSDLPDVSVIIPFRDEAWSTLIRTIHSVVNRTPPHLLKEIIISDDASTLEHLQKPLENYLVNFSKVKLVRLKERGGLIRTRLNGYNISSGTAVIFLDSHCEVTKGWIEPLLDRLATDDKIIVTSIIDVIEATDFRYRPYDIEVTAPIGTFDWRLLFKWDKYHYKSARHLPFPTPTIIGCLIGVSRRFFDEIGQFDEGFFIWGGENLEVSFKAWMCGGSVETLPCSHIGHVYKNRLPYDWGGKNKNKNNVLERNLLRLAATWLDDYIAYYKLICPKADQDIGDISGRLALKARLKCNSFDWFLSNVMPDLFIPGECSTYGEIRNKEHTNYCIDKEDDESYFGIAIVGMFTCHGMGYNQLWYLCKYGEIRRNRGCLTPTSNNNQLTQTMCAEKSSKHQTWMYKEDDKIYHVQTQQCLDVKFENKTPLLVLTQCTNTTSQQWTWTRGAPPGPIPKSRQKLP